MHSQRPLRAGAPLLLLALVFACSGAPPNPERRAGPDYEAVVRDLTRFIDERMRAEGLTGLSVALVDDQRLVWAQGFGWADRERRVPAGPQTLFRLGSITKLFTAVAVMQLVERGRVELDAPLERYLPEFSIGSRFPGSGPITVRRLLTHHAGLPSNHLDRLLCREPPPISAIVESLRDEQLAFAPGRIWAYSNVGYELLGALVERVSGQTYAEYLRREILLPLGMRGATVSQQLEALPGLSKGYRRGEPGRLYPLRAVPAGGLNASAEELALFVQMLFAEGRGRDGRVLRPETLARMLERQNADSLLDFELAIGLGFNLGSPKLDYAGRSAGHTGGIVYFRSVLVALPERRLGVVVLSNSNDGDRRDVLGRIATEALQRAVEAKFGLEPPRPEKRAEPRVEVPASELRGLLGSWATVLGPIRIFERQGGLEARVMDTPLELVRHPGGTWSLRYRLLGLVPIAPGPLGEVRLDFPRLEGRRVLAARYRGEWLLAGSPIAPYRISPAWRARLGAYEVEPGGAEEFAVLGGVRLEERDGLLLLWARQRPYPDLPQCPAVLRPLSDEVAVVDGFSGLGQVMGLTLRRLGPDRLGFAGLRLRRREGGP